MDTQQLKSLALYQHLNDSNYFVLDNEFESAFIGSREEAESAFAAATLDIEDDERDTFEEYLENSNYARIDLSYVESLIEDNDYLVLTDEEAIIREDEELQCYIDDCILPEIPQLYRNYFDEESWKEDARQDGRGHIISSYDGNEYTETVDGETFYIYRIN